MPSLIRLRPEHKKYHIVESPLVRNAMPLSVEQIEKIASEYLFSRTSENRDKLIMSFASIIRHIVGRYIGTWRSLLSMEDDLITEAFLKVTDVVDNLEAADDICDTISNRIVASLAHYINANRATWAPSLRTQHKLLNQGDDILISRYLDDEDTATYFTEDEISQVDFADAIEQMELTDPIDIEIMKRDSWDLTVAELAEKLGCSVNTVLRRRSALYSTLKGLLNETSN